MSLVDLITTVVLVAIVCVVAVYIFRWMAPPEPWNLIIRCLLGLIAFLLLIGFVTGKIPLIAVRI